MPNVHMQIVYYLFVLINIKKRSIVFIMGGEKNEREKSIIDAKSIGRV